MIAVLVLIAVVLLVMVMGAIVMRGARGGGKEGLGAMSDQWLAEHRASHTRPPGE